MQTPLVGKLRGRNARREVIATETKAEAVAVREPAAYSSPRKGEERTLAVWIPPRPPF